MKYRNRIKVLPGVHINVSRSGISTTVGPRGLNLNIGKKGTFLNTGIPGTGLYDRQRVGGKNKTNRKGGESPGQDPLFFALKNADNAGLASDGIHYPVESERVQDFGNIESLELESLTSPDLQDFQQLLKTCKKEQERLAIEKKRARRALFWARVLHFSSEILLVGFFFSRFRKWLDEKKEAYINLEITLKNTVVPVSFGYSEGVEQLFTRLEVVYRKVLTSKKVWDVTSSLHIDRKVSRMAAAVAIGRKEVSAQLKNLELIRSGVDAVHLENANGGDLYIYPGFLVVARKGDLAILDLKEVSITFRPVLVMEVGGFPTDALVVKKVWEKANKDGSPDKRYKDNQQIPVCQYGLLEWRSQTGLHEAWMFSDYRKAHLFASALQEIRFIDFTDN